MIVVASNQVDGNLLAFQVLEAVEEELEAAFTLEVRMSVVASVPMAAASTPVVGADKTIAVVADKTIAASTPIAVADRTAVAAARTVVVADKMVAAFTTVASMSMVAFAIEASTIGVAFAIEVRMIEVVRHQFPMVAYLVRPKRISNTKAFPHHQPLECSSLVHSMDLSHLDWPEVSATHTIQVTVVLFAMMGSMVHHDLVPMVLNQSDQRLSVFD